MKREKYISLYDNKYGVINHNGILEIFRHNERWKSKEESYIGDGFVLALVQKIEFLEDDLKQKTDCFNELIIACNKLIENNKQNNCWNLVSDEEILFEKALQKAIEILK